MTTIQWVAGGISVALILVVIAILSMTLKRVVLAVPPKQIPPDPPKKIEDKSESPKAIEGESA